MESCVDDIRSWMLTDSLKLNMTSLNFWLQERLSGWLKLTFIAYEWVIAMSPQSPLLETSGRGSWVVGRGSWVVGRVSCVVGP